MYRAFVENGCVVHDDMQVHREKKRYDKASNMSNSESQNRKGKGGRKPKFDYTSVFNVGEVKRQAKEIETLKKEKKYLC